MIHLPHQKIFQIVDEDFDCTDLIILEHLIDYYFSNFSSKNTDRILVQEGKNIFPYIRITSEQLIEKIPITRIRKEDTMSARIENLRKNGFLIYAVLNTQDQGRKKYFRIVGSKLQRILLLESGQTRNPQNGIRAKPENWDSGGEMPKPVERDSREPTSTLAFFLKPVERDSRTGGARIYCIITNNKQQLIDNNVRPINKNQLTLIRSDDTKKEIKEDSTKKDVEEVFAYYKEKVLPGARLTPEAVKRIKTRLKNYSKQELKKCVDNFSSSKWNMENNASRGTVWFFESDARIEKVMFLKEKAEPKTIDLNG